MLLASLLLAAALPTQAGTPARPDPMQLGPRIGDTLPAFEAPDQDGRPRDLASLRGPNGLVFVLFRSADW